MALHSNSVLVPAQPESNNVPSRGINKEICFITLILFYYSPQQQKLTLLSDLFFLHRVVRRPLYFPEKKISSSTYPSSSHRQLPY
ncbi:hypothetical protein UUU_26470 (plasmid) [Klebsiella pneumoniae subsp. pneumoniae DSM 30104 = JCM 1662 = NBRC 14940]|nr:hypothetical protein UUU_26470 [Klebsiella pneumoniae subsp. pneumoniae DSM 30104 = JCM 1662 = NBRC 14940]